MPVRPQRQESVLGREDFRCVCRLTRRDAAACSIGALRVRFAAARKSRRIVLADARGRQGASERMCENCVSMVLAQLRARKVHSSRFSHRTVTVHFGLAEDIVTDGASCH
jgi:hypothetical protein